MDEDHAQDDSIAKRAATAVGFLPEEKAAARQRMLSGKGDPSKSVGRGKAEEKPDPSKLVGRGRKVRRPDEAVDRAGRRAGVSGETVRQAERIAKAAPDVFAAMKAGVLHTMADARRLALLGQDARTKVLNLIEAGSSAKEAILRASGDDELPSLKKPVQERVLLQRLGKLLDQIGDLPEKEQRRCLGSFKDIVAAQINHVDAVSTTSATPTYDELDPGVLDFDDLDLDDLPTVRSPSAEETSSSPLFMMPDEQPDIEDDPERPSDEVLAEMEEESFGQGFDFRVEQVALGFFVPFRSTDIVERLDRCSHQKVSAALRRLGWTRAASTLLRDGRQGPRWLPQVFDGDIVQDVAGAYSSGWTEIHEEQQEKTWKRWGDQVK